MIGQQSIDTTSNNGLQLCGLPVLNGPLRIKANVATTLQSWILTMERKIKFNYS